MSTRLHPQQPSPISEKPPSEDDNDSLASYVSAHSETDHAPSHAAAKPSLKPSAKPVAAVGGRRAKKRALLSLGEAHGGPPTGSKEHEGVRTPHSCRCS